MATIIRHSASSPRATTWPTAKKVARVPFLRGRATPIFGAAIFGVFSCLIVLLLLFGQRPTRQRALEATVEMEQFTNTLSHARRIAPETARIIAGLIRQPRFDCRQMECDAALLTRNQKARSRLQALLAEADRRDEIMAKRSALPAAKRLQ